ncbi:MAG: PhzF family phenazine biosynthesis protein [Rhodoferax sp.]|nr:PhzF family phenazine biosynthesis protein [Rhodoferax sp.]
MPRPRPFTQVDVFSAQPYLGNALAVVLDGTGLSDTEMQRFAAWTNLSETTFVLPPTPEAAAAGADYRVRIFTTAYEMPFAGHPTLGTCHAWLAHGGVPKDPARIVQQCQVGLVPLRREGARLAFAAPALRRRTPDAVLLQALPRALGVAPQQIRAAQHLDNGPQHFGVWLDSVDTVLGLQPDLAGLRALMATHGFSGLGVAASHANAAQAPLIGRSNREARAFGARAPEAPEPDLEVRFFFDRGDGVGEDPITGSFNASLAQWLVAEGHAPASYVAAQGRCIGREGRVFVAQDGAGQVWVGGDAVSCITGEIKL